MLLLSKSPLSGHGPRLATNIVFFLLLIDHGPSGFLKVGLGILGITFQIIRPRTVRCKSMQPVKSIDNDRRYRVTESPSDAIRILL